MLSVPAALAQMTAPNPYRAVEGVWGQLPAGRTWGATSGVWPGPDGTIWVTDALGFGQQPAGVGHIIVKFSPTGQVLMTLGKKGVAGRGPDTFGKPSAVLVAPNGDLFVADGHDAGSGGSTSGAPRPVG